MNSEIRKGIVSVGTKFHAYYTAKALLNNNMLEYLIAGRKIKNKVLPEDKVINISLPQYAGIAIRKSKILNKIIPYNLVSDVIFDKLAINKLSDNIDFFIGFNNYVLEQMKELKKRNVLLILDQRTAHGNTEKKTGIEENAKIPVNLSNKMLKRKEAEIELADYILVPSQFVYNSMVENGVQEKKLILLPYGYNSKLFYVSNKVSIKKGRFNLIFVGSICHRKGCEYLLLAFSNLKKRYSDISLTMVGNVEPEFKSIFNKYSNIIEYKGYVDNEKLVNMYNEADIFVFPSLCEGSALVTYEAAACGLPLIVTGSTGSFIKNGEEGIIIKSKSVEEIENAILKLYRDNKLRELMKKNIKEKSKEYTWESYEKKLVDIISDLCK